MSVALSARIREKYSSFVRPTPEGLPRLRIVLAFPALLLVLGVILVALGINGTSSGAYYGSVYTGSDPALLAGKPEAIRSDEWNTGTSWTISQLQQGLPERNGTFPGGMDAALPYDLPRVDWSVAFRPHLIGFLVLDADHGQAWRWWASGFALMMAVYVFAVTVLPRRPVVAAGLAVAFFYSPFFQWWYQSSTFWPAVWALATMAALVWVSKSARRAPRWIWAAVIAYLTAVMAMGIYVPYILTVAYVVGFFALGLALENVRTGSSWRRVWRGYWPIVAGGAAGAVITIAFLASRASTVEGFLSTVYPGARLTDTGSATGRDLARVVGSSFTESLQNAGVFLGANSSEASTFFLVGLFLLPIVVLAIVRQRRRGAALPWTLIGLASAAVLFAVYALVPGWNLIAHVLLLDRIPIDSVRVGVTIGLGLVSLAMLVFTIRYLDDTTDKPRRLIAWIGPTVFLLSQLGIAAAIVATNGIAALQGAAPYWWFFALASTAALLHFGRGRPLLGVIALLLATVPASASVNPAYVGIFDLRQTPIARVVAKVDHANPGTWVGIGQPVVAATLVESGVRAYNGVQGAPSSTMWSTIDPQKRARQAWDRIGFVNWTPGAGEPKVTNPSEDQIVVTFDACSRFAQKNVDYVLAEGTLSGSCLAVVGHAKTQVSTYTVYRVVQK